MLRFVFAGATTLLLIGAALPAGAGVVDNTSLAPPGVYFGSGNSNSHFTVDTENGVEVGLSAIIRYLGAVTPVGSVYTVPTGATTAPTKTGSTWGVDFSINLGTTDLTLSNITAVLTYTDANTGVTNALDPFNVLTGIPDNTFNGNIGAQNSEPGSLLALIGDPNFNENVPDIYTFDLKLTRLDQTQLADVGIQVDAVPEPASMALLGTALLGFGGIGWRRRRKA